MNVKDMVIAWGDQLVLRRLGPGDLEMLLAAYQEGDWRDYDAPFERFDLVTEELRSRLGDWCKEPEAELPRRALIQSPSEAVIGMVSHYGEPRFPAARMLGIDIFAEEHWGQGLGREALTLWVDLIFEQTDYHRVGLATWSLNPRMMALAARLGFRPEGVERELVEWRGDRLDRHRFGLLRSEWEARRAADAPTIRLMAPAEASACEDLLRALPDWFGIPEAIDGYRRDIESMETFVADDLSGFLTLKSHGEGAAEIQVMAVAPDAHRQGIGRQLVEHAEVELKRRGCRLLQVKTLAPERESEHYARTRRFYTAMGFAPLEVFPELWDPGNPCLLLVKGL